MGRVGNATGSAWGKWGSRIIEDFELSWICPRANASMWDPFPHFFFFEETPIIFYSNNCLRGSRLLVSTKIHLSIISQNNLTSPRFKSTIVFGCCVSYLFDIVRIYCRYLCVHWVNHRLCVTNSKL